MSEKVIANRKFLEKQVKLIFEENRHDASQKNTALQEYEDSMSKWWDRVTADYKALYDITVGTGKEIGKGVNKNLQKTIRDFKIKNYKVQGLIQTALYNRKDSIPHLGEIKAFLSMFNDFKAISPRPDPQDIENIDLDKDDDTPVLEKKGLYTSVKSYNINQMIPAILTDPFVVRSFDQKLKSYYVKGDAKKTIMGTLEYKSRNEVYQETLNKIIYKIEKYHTSTKSEEQTVDRWFEKPTKTLADTAARYNWSYEATVSRCLKLLNFYISKQEIVWNPENTLDENLDAIKSTFIQRINNTPQMMDSWHRFVSASLFDPTGFYDIDQFGALHQAGRDAAPEGVDDAAIKLLMMIAEEELARRLALYLAARIVPGKKNILRMVHWIIILYYLIAGFTDILSMIKDVSGIKAAKEKMNKIKLILQPIYLQKRDATREENVAVANLLNEVIRFAGAKIFKMVNVKVDTPDYRYFLAIQYYLGSRIQELSNLTQNITKDNIKEIYDAFDEAIKVLKDSDGKITGDWNARMEDYYLVLESNHIKQSGQITIIEQALPTPRVSAPYIKASDPPESKFSQARMEKDIEAFLNVYKEKMKDKDYKNLETYKTIMETHNINDRESFENALKRKDKTSKKQSKIVRDTDQLFGEESLSYYKKIWARFWSRNIQTYSYRLATRDQKYPKVMKLFDTSESSTAKKNGVAYKPTYSKLLGKKVIPLAFVGPIQTESGKKYNSFFFFHTHPDDSLQKIYNTGMYRGKKTRIFKDERIQLMEESTFWENSSLKKRYDAYAENMYNNLQQLTKNASDIETKKKAITELENMKGFYYKQGQKFAVPPEPPLVAPKNMILWSDKHAKALRAGVIDDDLLKIVRGSRRVAGLLYVQLRATENTDLESRIDDSGIAQRIYDIIDKDKILTEKLKQIDDNLIAGTDVEQNTQQFMNISAEKINNFLKIIKLDNDIN